MLAGEVTTNAQVEIAPLVRQVVQDIGYTDSDMGFDAATCAVTIALGRQSPDISQGVTEGEGLHKEQGAGDQGMMFGFACDETPELMPAPIRLAHQLIETHRQHFESGELEYLRPDAKSQVTVEYDGDRPVRISAVVLSTQHSPDVTHDQLREDVIEQIIRPTLPAELVDDDTIFHVNPTGRFVVGGPDGRRRAHGTQDHRRHLRRHGPPRRRRLLGQGSLEGRSQRGLRGPLGREEPRPGGRREALRGAARLRDRRAGAGLDPGRDLRHRKRRHAMPSRSWCASTST